MAITISRRDLMQSSCGTAATLAVSAVAGEFATGRARAQGAPGDASKEDLFFREDWFGEPWRKPEAAVLIHGNDESSIVWFGWVPRMGQEFRLIRPDLPGFGRSRIPAGFEWSLPSLATFVARVLDKAGVESAHIIGAKTGGAIAMQFAADYPGRTRTLAVASGPASVINIASRSKVPLSRPVLMYMLLPSSATLCRLCPPPCTFASNFQTSFARSSLTSNFQYCWYWLPTYMKPSSTSGVKY
jgi:pimeloyl-ACP methyl ester carboxylesterase